MPTPPAMPSQRAFSGLSGAPPGTVLPGVGPAQGRLGACQAGLTCFSRIRMEPAGGVEAGGAHRDRVAAVVAQALEEPQPVAAAVHGDHGRVDAPQLAVADGGPHLDAADVHDPASGRAAEQGAQLRSQPPLRQPAARVRAARHHPVQRDSHPRVSGAAVAAPCHPGGERSQRRSPVANERAHVHRLAARAQPGPVRAPRRPAGLEPEADASRPQPEAPTGHDHEHRPGEARPRGTLELRRGLRNGEAADVHAGGADAGGDHGFGRRSQGWWLLCGRRHTRREQRQRGHPWQQPPHWPRIPPLSRVFAASLYSGMFPCLRLGRSTRLVCSVSSARISSRARLVRHDHVVDVAALGRRVGVGEAWPCSRPSASRAARRAWATAGCRGGR